MDFDKLKKNIKAANTEADLQKQKEAEEEAKKIAEQNEKLATSIEAYRAKMKIFNMIEDYQKEFIEEIKSLSDDRLQQFFEKYFISFRDAQSRSTIDLIFYFITPKITIAIDQNEDMDKWHEVFNEYGADMGFKTFDDYYNHHKEFDSVWKKLDVELNFFGSYKLDSAICSLITIDIPKYNFTDSLTFCTDHVYGIYDDNNKMQYKAMEKVLTELIDKYTIDTMTFDYWKYFNKEFTAEHLFTDSSEDILQILTKRFIDFDLDILDTKVLRFADSAELHISIKNPLL